MQFNRDGLASRELINGGSCPFQGKAMLLKQTNEVNWPWNRPACKRQPNGGGSGRALAVVLDCDRLF